MKITRPCSLQSVADLETAETECLTSHRNLDRTKASNICELFKVLSNERRLILMCLLTEGPRTVSELEHLASLPQAEVSQILGRLKKQGLSVSQRRERNVYCASANHHGVGIVRAITPSIMVGVRPTGLPARGDTHGQA